MRIALAAFLSLLAGNAWGQAAVQQVGPATKYDATGWIQDHQIESSSKMFGDNKRGFNSFHVYDSGKEQGVCVEDKLTSGPFHQLCLGHDSSGNAVISSNPGNGATGAGLNFTINGNTYPFDNLLSGAVTITGLVQVPSNSSLLAIPTSQLSNVYRAGFYNPGDGGDAWYSLSNAPCALSSGNGDNGSQVKASNGNCWIANVPPTGWRPEMFGAVRNGTTNVAASVQAAANAAQGGRLNFGPYWYCVGTPISIKDNTRVEGVGRGDWGNAVAGLRACAQNMTSVLTLGNSVYVGHLHIAGANAGVNTSGVGIATPSGVRHIVIDNVWLDGSCVGTTLNGNTLTITDSYITGQQGAGCGGIMVGNLTTGTLTSDVRIRGVTISTAQTNQADYDTFIADCGGCSIDGYSDFLFAKRGFVIEPGAGQAVKGGFFNNSALGDSNTEYATTINTANSSAVVADITFSASWSASSAGNAGVMIANNSNGVVSNISFLGHRAYNNVGWGYVLYPGITNVRISDNQFCNNGQGGADSADILLQSGVSKIQLVGNHHQGLCGWPPSLYEPTWGVYLAGNNSNIIITGNNLTGSSSTHIYGTPVGDSLIASNLGIEGGFASTASSGGTLSLSSVWPRWGITNTAAISNITGGWNSRSVMLYPAAGVISFTTGGNICNAMTSPAGSYVIASYDIGSTCWLLK